jgi:hypothetical protein
MNSPAQIAKLESRVNALVDDRLFKAFWDAVAHFKTNDLVLFFDESKEVDPVTAHVRDKLITAADAPESLRKKLNKPARDAAIRLTASETAFWLVVMFTDGEMASVAINAKLVGPGGNA